MPLIFIRISRHWEDLCLGSTQRLATSFYNSDKISPQNIAGNTKYDVVTKYMGKDWHIPTKAECEELIR